MVQLHLLIKIDYFFSASVVCLRMPSAIPSRVLPFSVMLKIVFGRSVPTWPSCIVSIIFDIVPGATLASYRTLTYQFVLVTVYVSNL
jgi:hypothetical protein